MNESTELNNAAIPLSKAKKWVVLLTLMMLGFVTSYVIISRATFLPVVMAEFEAMQFYALVSVAGLLSVSMALPIAGKLGDLYGRRAVLCAALLLFAASCILTGAASNAFLFILGIFLCGLGHGSATSSIKTLVADVCATSERPKIQGYFGVLENGSQLAGPVLGGLMADFLNWRWVYFLCAPLLFLGLVIIYRALPPARAGVRKKVSIDFAGLLAFIVVLPPFLVLLSMGGSAIPWFSGTSYLLAGISVLGFIALILIERKAPEPMIPLTLFGDAVFRRAFLVAFLSHTASSFMNFFALYLQNVRGLSSSVTGTLQLPRGIVTVLIVGFVGFLISKTHRYRLVIIMESGALLIGSLMFLAFTPDSSLALFVLSTVLNGLGMGGLAVCFITYVQGTVAPKNIGAASSLVIFSISFGQSIGSAVCGMFVNQAWAKAPSLIPQAVRAALSEEHFALLVNQATLQSAETISQIRSALPAELFPVFDDMIFSLRVQLMQGLKGFNLFCAAAAALAIFFAFRLSDKAAKTN